MTVPGAVADHARLRTETAVVTSDGADIAAYVARPATPGRHPAIIVIHEAFGPVEHIHDVARRFAQQGYLAIAPDLYSREGQPTPGDMDDLLAKMFGQDDAQAVRDLEAVAGWLRADAEGNGRVAVIGFCSGGRLALLFASATEAPDAAISCWGGFVHRATFEDETTAARPRKVIDVVPGLSCPLLAVSGAEDDNPSPAEMDVLRRALEAGGKEFEMRVYEGAGHAFFADYRDSYHPDAAHELWAQILGFLERTVG